MAGNSIRIKKYRLYYYIRRFYKGTCDYNHYHVDRLSDISWRDKKLKKYWYPLALEAYQLSKEYIQKKHYQINVIITMAVKIRNSEIGYNLKLDDIKSTYEPYAIYLAKGELFWFSNLVPDAVYSSELSQLLGRPVYKWHNDEEEDDDVWYLYLL